MNAPDELPPRAAPETEEERNATQRPVRVQVAEILHGGREAIIEHGGQDYRLRITSNGKLILTK